MSTLTEAQSHKRYKKKCRLAQSGPSCSGAVPNFENRDGRLLYENKIANEIECGDLRKKHSEFFYPGNMDEGHRDQIEKSIKRAEGC